MRRAILALLVCAACATTAPAPPPAAPAAAATTPPPDPDAALRREVAALGEEVRALLKAQAELAWKSWALGESVDFASAAAGREALFSAESIGKVKALAAREKDPEAARALRRLHGFLAGEHLARAAAEPAEALARRAASATFTADGADYPLRDLEGLLAAEGHTGKRRRLDRAACAASRTLDAPLRERERRLSQAAVALGYPSLTAFAAEVREADPAQLGALAEDVLARTEGIYRAGMEELARRELNLPLSEVRRADVARLFRTGTVDTSFPPEKSLEGLTATLARLGLDPAKLPQLRLDAEPRARKNPRALAVAVEAGRDVRLSLRPARGLGAAAQRLHEAGHALPAALATAPSSELPLLGSGAVAEAYGYLFENLLDDPRFAAASGIPESMLAAHVRVSALRKLHLLRRHAGRVLFELAWRAGASDPEALFLKTLARAQGFPADAEEGARWRLELEEPLVGADHLRGLVLAAQLEAALAKALGETWWSDPRAADTLRAWMAAGGSLGAEGLAALAGAPGLDPAPLLSTLTARLGGAR